MSGRICISGSGVVSAVGIGKQESLKALLEGRRGLSAPRYLNTVHKNLPIGEVPLSNGEMKKRLGLPENETIPRTSLLAMLSAREALQEAGMPGGRKAFISGTTVGEMDIKERSYLGEGNPAEGPQDCGSSSNRAADYLGGFSLVTSPSTACSSAANSLILGSLLLQSGAFDVVVAGGSECMSRFHLNGFHSLMIVDPKPCRPFDATRQGLNLGEGAAYLVLETEEHALSRGVKPLAYLDGWGNACDAYHQTASSEEGEGAYLAMTKALSMAGLRPSDIDYINAHGTGTPNNDASESRALFRVFGEKMPPVSSTKGFTGHTTSASGSIEAVFCLLALQEGFIPGNPGFQTPFEGGVVPQEQSVPAPGLSHVLCNAFGFGGNDTSLILSRAL